MSKHLLILTLALAAAALAAGCGAKASDVANPQPLAKNSFARQWSTQLMGGADNPVTAIHPTDQFIFAYRQDGSSNVLDRATGRLLHVDEPRDGAQRLHPPVLLGDRIVYPTTTYLEVFDTSGRYIAHPTKPSDENGKPCSQNLDGPIRTDAVGTGKFIFLGVAFAGGGRIVEVDMTRPYVPALWTLMEPGSDIAAAPAINKDVVYVASEAGSVAAVSISTRDPLWQLPNGVFGTYGGVVANLENDASGLYVASTDTKLYCLNAATGKVKWQYFAGAALRDPPVLTRDSIYQVVPGGGLVALDKAGAGTSAYNRQARWVASDAVQFLSQDDHYVYARSGDNHVVALDKRTGERRFASQRADLSAFGINPKGDGLIYLSTNNARVLAVRPVLQPGGIGEVVLAPIAAPMHQQPPPLAMAR